jgi:hypothetical protein
MERAHNCEADQESSRRSQLVMAHALPELPPKIIAAQRPFWCMRADHHHLVLDCRLHNITLGRKGATL